MATDYRNTEIPPSTSSFGIPGALVYELITVRHCAGCGPNFLMPTPPSPWLVSPVHCVTDLQSLKHFSPLVNFQRRYQNSHRIFRNLLCSRDFRQFCAPKIGSCFVSQFLGLTQTCPSHLFRHQMITYLTWDLSDTQIQPDLCHESKKSLEIYQHLSLDAVEQAYEEAVQGVSI